MMDAERSEREREICGFCSLSLKDGGSGHSQGMNVIYRIWKSKGMDSLLEHPEGLSHCQLLDFRTSCLQNCKMIAFVVLGHYVFCYTCILSCV